ncbi:MAG: general secretion pathway protein GspK [Verrucomicrobia bacterium]|nr:general secretion pathway protein GspK [Verrucomicrobiota bacterium]
MKSFAGVHRHLGNGIQELTPGRQTCSTMARASGSVLVITLWAMFGLVSLTLYFGQSMSVEMKTAENRAAATAASQVLEGGARYAGHLLNNLVIPGQLPTSAEYRSQASRVGEGAFWFIGREDASLPSNHPYFALTDESAKLNINYATLQQLELLPMMNSSLAAAIIDWRDSDQEITSGGAEDETYSRLTPPYRAKNSNFESIEELRMVFGMTRELLYGEDANLNGILDPNENDGDASLPLDNRDGRLDAGILEYVTVQTTSPTGQTRVLVNANTASEAVLTCIPGLGEDNAATLVSYRRSHPNELSSAQWISDALQGTSIGNAMAYLTNTSSFFSADIAAVGRHGRGYRREKFFFDSSSGTAQIVGRQDLTGLGWALGQEARSALAQLKEAQ